MKHAAVALAGALGALARYAMGNWLTAHLPTDFPLATLLINLAGSLLLGFVTGFGVEQGHLPEAWRVPVTAGFIGAFTTFSTWTVDTILLLDAGRLGLAGFNAAVSLVLGLGAVAAGHRLASRVARKGGFFMRPFRG